ncbi:hypothetical protein CCON61_08660 [Campylobacter concisus]|nr:hypothetical protein CCON61_08660 [Campylobacter concisus]
MILIALQARNCKQKRRNFQPKIKQINLSHQDKKFLFCLVILKPQEAVFFARCGEILRYKGAYI